MFRPNALALFVATLSSLFVSSDQAADPDIYQIDRAHASLGFSVRLAGFNKVRGAFDRYEGHITYDQEHPENSSVTVVIDVSSIRTGNEERDTHLRSADFFDTARYPTIIFRSIRVERSSSSLVVTGQLTIRDVTREVQLPAELVSPIATDPFGNQRVAFAANLRLNRRDFGVNGPRFWSMAISEDVDIELEIPGRIWTYSRLSWSGRGRMSIGQWLLAERDSGRFESALDSARSLWGRPNRDSLYLFAVFEIEKASGRLIQAGQSADALEILKLGCETIGKAPSPEGSWLFALRARAELSLGQQRQAWESLRTAIAYDSTNTLAAEIARKRAGGH